MKHPQYKILIFLALVFGVLNIILSFFGKYPGMPQDIEKAIIHKGTLQSFNENILTYVLENSKKTFSVKLVPETKIIVKIYDKLNSKKLLWENTYALNDAVHFLLPGRKIWVQFLKTSQKQAVSSQVVVEVLYLPPSPEEIKKMNELYPPRHLPGPPPGP